MIRPRLLLLTFVLAFAGAAVPAGAATYTDLSEFRAAAGGRLIDWEDHAAGAVAADDYRSRGVVLDAPGEVSGPSGSHVFQTPGSPTTTISLVVPGTSTPAVARGFGVRFSNPPQGKLELLDVNGEVIDSVTPSSAFAGILLSSARVVRVRVTGAPLDDFAYPEPLRDSDGDGTSDRADSDDDNDGSPDTVEARRGTDSRRVDSDGDGVNDPDDDCPMTPGEACSDVFPPVLAKLALRPAKFETGSKRGTRVSFRLNEAATVELRVLRVVGPRRPPLSGIIERRATAGTNFVKFAGRIGGRDLKPGRYVLAASARDAAGNLSFEQPRARFTVLD